jgi:uncharacterized membrane protein
MKPRTRRVLQAVLYEVFAVAFVGPVLGIVFDKPQASTLAQAVVLVFFFVYAVGFTWAFDRVFGLPQAARPAG